MIVSVVVVVFGEDERLAKALASLRTQHCVRECVVMHHASADESTVRDDNGIVHVHTKANPGFAAGFNNGLALTDGEFVFSLNPDARLESGALDAALTAMLAQAQCGGIALRLLRPDGVTLDSAGIALSWLRRGRDRGMGEQCAGRFVRAEQVDAACMAAALFRRAALLEARDGAGEVLDSRFFAYKEDVDLCWRLRRAGWAIRYEPAAVAVHERGWREGQRRKVAPHLRALSFGNRWLMILKNESAGGCMLRALPWLMQEVLLTLWLLVTEPSTLKGYAHALRGARGSLSRRRLLGKSSA